MVMSNVDEDLLPRREDRLEWERGRKMRAVGELLDSEEIQSQRKHSRRTEVPSEGRKMDCSSNKEDLSRNDACDMNRTSKRISATQVARNRAFSRVRARDTHQRRDGLGLKFAAEDKSA
jgi:hypothetical protein